MNSVIRLTEYLVLPICLILCACGTKKHSQAEKDAPGQDASAGLFDNMASPDQYNRIVAKAENGDYKSINQLSFYYTFGSGPTDFRNLLYWSQKAYAIEGSIAYINYISSSADEGYCSQAWFYADKYYRNLELMRFYKKSRTKEYINDKCERAAKKIVRYQ